MMVFTCRSEDLALMFANMLRRRQDARLSVAEAVRWMFGIT